MPNTARPATVDIRARVLTALRAAHGRELTTSEICARAGFTNFEHHAYVSPQLRALAKRGVIIRSPFVPGAHASWRINAHLDRAEPATG
ncbi:hypothetical protein ACM0CO_19215 [Mycobacteroides abscessus subsp. abscessus]|uniref:hypothetical protein n=1 Tax=Mycobacteroides abscessus TaxID=36809 RepID=UPI0039EE103E